MKEQIEQQIDKLKNEAAQLTLEKYDLVKNQESIEKRLSQIETEIISRSGALRTLEALLNTPDIPGQEEISKEKEPIKIEKINETVKNTDKKT